MTRFFTYLQKNILDYSNINIKYRRNYLVEIKNEYTLTLVNILTPLIYQGIESIYKDSEKLGNENEILKIFQGLLRRVPKWNQNIIDNETKRILSNSKCSDWLYDLIKAVIKSNIILLTYQPKKKNNNLNIVKKEFYESISLSDFIHKVYIECAREIWNNPYLFSHDYNPIDIKRNQRDALFLIKEAIREAIRKMLPVRHILESYLGNNFLNDEDNFESSIVDQSQNIRSLLKEDLENNIIENKILNSKNNSFNETMVNINDNNGLNLNDGINPNDGFNLITDLILMTDLILIM